MSMFLQRRAVDCLLACLFFGTLLRRAQEEIYRESQFLGSACLAMTYLNGELALGTWQRDLNLYSFY